MTGQRLRCKRIKWGKRRKLARPAGAVYRAEAGGQEREEERKEARVWAAAQGLSKGCGGRRRSVLGGKTTRGGRTVRTKKLAPAVPSIVSSSRLKSWVLGSCGRSVLGRIGQRNIAVGWGAPGCLGGLGLGPGVARVCNAGQCPRGACWVDERGASAKGGRTWAGRLPTQCGLLQLESADQRRRLSALRWLGQACRQDADARAAGLSPCSCCFKALGLCLCQQCQGVQSSCGRGHTPH